VVTIRYYERIGLTPKPSCTEGNHQAYGREHLRRLRFIRRCWYLGFTLGQARGLSCVGLLRAKGARRSRPNHGAASGGDQAENHRSQATGR
jgi:hypothetical protein